MRCLARPTDSPELIRTFAASGSIQRTARFLPDGHRLISLDGNTFRLWDVATGLEVGSLFLGENSGINTYDISADGRRLAAFASSGGWNKVPAALFDLVRLVPVCTLEGEPGHVEVLAFSPSGSVLVVGGKGGAIDWRDAESGRRVGRCVHRDQHVSHLCFDPTGVFLLSGGGETLRLWDVRTRRHVATLVGHAQLLETCAFSADGQHIVSGASRELFLWHVGVGRIEPAWHIRERGSVRRCWFTPDGEAVCVADDDGNVTLRDAETGDEMSRTDTGTWHVAVSPDGTRLATARY